MIYSMPLCDGTRNFYWDRDRDQGRDQIYDGTGIKTWNKNIREPGSGPRTGTRFGPGPQLGPGQGPGQGPRTGQGFGKIKEKHKN